MGTIFSSGVYDKDQVSRLFKIILLTGDSATMVVTTRKVPILVSELLVARVPFRWAP